jgi:cytochrome c oxidase cbb3-type subunit 4
MMSGILTIIMLLMFFGIIAWAYSSRRRADFAEAAQLPLIENTPGRNEESHA